ncbi:signal peptidase I [Agromyces protaetiae]|uniref:Signal peptidase I n=1 Tax=Agromyces protaetiae TaxID=2509455 RepID=A0A4P6FEG4_9MICO|nr:signal peptidase I [Agromyces protaetiae]QAY72077.1 signal peptidase I [Agromyces protaetiae]
MGAMGASGRRGALRFLRDILIIALVAVAVSFLVKTFFLRSFFIPSQSMSHTLEVDDRILVNVLVPETVALERGDVVVFRDPGGWLPPPPRVEKAPAEAVIDVFLGLIGVIPTDSGEHLVKRVIGLPGDHVVCCDASGRLSVNGMPVDEPYVVHEPDDPRASGTDFDVTVPDDALWVMGDNRYHSLDSRYQDDTPSKGYVPVEDVVGRAFVVSWPTSHWAWLDNYPESFEDVPADER